MPYRYPEEPVGAWFLEDFDKFLLWADQQNASDVMLVPAKPLWIKVHGKWMTVTRRPIGTNEIETLMDSMSRSNSSAAQIKGAKDIDFPHEVRKDRFSSVRFRVNGTGCRIGWSAGITVVMRTIPALPPALETLKVEPNIMTHGFPENGLVLATGVMGQGKSTLLASMLRHLNETRAKSIMTYEAPIEFDLTNIPNAMGPVTQTEVPTHLESFVVAPRNSARRAADVVMVGESRDPETLHGMIEQAEIGTAVYSTVHTRGVAETPTRIINVFPSDRHNQIASTLIPSLRLIIQQRLLPAIGGGRIAIREILAFDSGMRDELITVPTHDLIPAIQEQLKRYGQPLLSDARQKYRDNRISKEELHKIEHEFEVVHAVEKAVKSAGPIDFNHLSTRVLPDLEKDLLSLDLERKHPESWKAWLDFKSRILEQESTFVTHQNNS